MELNIVFKNIEPTDALKSYFEKRVKKLERIFKKNFEVKAVMSTEKFRQCVEVIVTVDGNVIKGEETSSDMYSAIDLVIDKLDRQARKYREKLKNRKHHNHDEVTVTSFTEESNIERQIIKVDNDLGKPLTVEEGAMELESSEHEFIIFRNAENNRINIIYKRNDGNYGWVDPE